jgi:flagellar motor switch protein FliM
MTAPNKNLEALAVPGGRGRAACDKVAGFSNDLAVALRRSVPFLARKRVPVTAETPRCVSFAELAADETIVHATAFAMKQKKEDAGTHGLILLDETALSRILDGVLGGDGSPSGGAKRPTAAQGALASRISVSLLKAFAEVLTSKLEVMIEPHPSKDIGSGGAVITSLAIEGGGQILVALPLNGIRADEALPAVDVVDPGLANAIQEVELDVVAELGKVRLPLDAIVKLQVGDVLRLSLPLDERARVCAGGAVIFHGRPTASGDVVGVALERTAA